MTIPATIATGGHATDAEIVDAQNALLQLLAAFTNGVLKVANGGSGSGSQNFVDLTTGQNIAGQKVFTDTRVYFGVGSGTDSYATLRGGAANKQVLFITEDSTGALTWAFGSETNGDFIVYSGAGSRYILRCSGTGAVTIGSLAVGVVSKTANYGAGPTDYLILCDATGGAFTITLPAATQKGQILAVIKTDASINAVTVARAGADTIEGGTTKALALQYDKVTLIADGISAWYDLGKGLI